MDSIPLPRFYVYTLARPDGTVFYVGKGQGKRIDRHEQFARLGYGGHRCNLIRQIWRQGGQVQKQIVFRSNDEDATLAYEVALIASFPPGQLVNLTAGGDGVRDYQWTPEARARVSAGNKRHKPTPLANQHVSEALKGHPVSEETRAKIGAKQRAHFQSPEGLTQQQERIERARTPEARAKISATSRARQTDPARRSEQSAKVHAYYADPDVRADHAAKIRAAMADPSVRAKISQARQARKGLAQAARQEAQRATQSQEQRARMTDPARRAHLAACRRTLSPEQVAEIRARLAAGESQTAIARAFGLGISTVHHIKRGDTYRDG